MSTEADDYEVNQNCTLREAIKAAISNTDVDQCPAGSVSAVDTIILPSGNYAITIQKGNSATPASDETNGDFDLYPGSNQDGGTIITGQGKDLTSIDGGSIDRLFHIHGSSVTLTIQDVTLKNGVSSDAAINRGGGAVFNAGTLILENVLVTNNRTDVAGGGIDNRSQLMVRNSEFSGNFAFIFNDGGGAGGAIFNASAMTIENSLFTNNVAEREGGAIVNDYEAETINVTISGNSSPKAGGISSLGSIVLQNATIFDNQSNEVPSGKNLVNGLTGVTLIDSIIFSSFGDDGNCEEPVSIPVGINLVNGTSCGTQPQIITSFSDQVLHPLGDNGGPTRTHELLPNTPAVDGAASIDCPSTDQRGIARPQGAACDIGAYELVPPPPGEENSIVFLPILRK